MSSENNKHLEYKNKSELEVSACGETHIIYSNEVEAKKVVIRIEKTQSKQCVFAGDHLDYTIKICNDSLVDIYDPVFCDDIPEGLEYVQNSFKVNNKPETPVKQPYDNKISFKLDEIKAESEVTITFKTTVL